MLGFCPCGHFTPKFLHGTSVSWVSGQKKKEYLSRTVCNDAALQYGIAIAGNRRYTAGTFSFVPSLQGLRAEACQACFVWIFPDLPAGLFCLV